MVQQSRPSIKASVKAQSRPSLKAQARQSSSSSDSGSASDSDSGSGSDSSNFVTPPSSPQRRSTVKGSERRSPSGVPQQNLPKKSFQDMAKKASIGGKKASASESDADADSGTMRLSAVAKWPGFTHPNTVEKMLATLDDELKLIKGDVSSEIRRKLTLRAQLRTLHEETGTATADLDHAINEHKQMEVQLRDSQKQHAFTTEGNAHARRALMQARAQLGASEEEREELQKVSTKTVEEHLKLDAQRSGLFMGVAKLREKLSSLQAKTHTCRHDLSVVLTQKKKLEAEAGAVERDLVEMQQMLDEATQDKKEAQSRYQELMSRKIKAQGLIGQLEAEKTALKEKIGVVRAEVHSQEGHVGKRGQEIKQLGTLLYQVDMRNQSLQFHAKRSEKEKVDMTERLNDLEDLQNQLHDRIGTAMIQDLDDISNPTASAPVSPTDSRFSGTARWRQDSDADHDDAGASPGKVVLFKRSEMPRKVSQTQARKSLAPGGPRASVAARKSLAPGGPLANMKSRASDIAKKPARGRASSSGSSGSGSSKSGSSQSGSSRSSSSGSSR